MSCVLRIIYKYINPTSLLLFNIEYILPFFGFPHPTHLFFPNIKQETNEIRKSYFKIFLTSIVHLTSFSSWKLLGSSDNDPMVKLCAICFTTWQATSRPTLEGNLWRTDWFPLSHCISSCSEAHSQYIVKV